MNLDTRARRAAEGVRASTRGVDPMAQITELKREDQARRRTARTTAALGAVVVVAGAGWLALTQLGGGGGVDPQPMSSPDVMVTAPDPDSSAPTLTPGRTVGTRLQPPLVAKAPDSWSVWKDGAFVWLDGDGTESTMTHIEFSGPIVEVFDPEQQAGVPIPGQGYADWLRGNPALDVIDDQMVVVDGERFPQLTVTMADDAPGKQFRLGRTNVNPMPREEWPDYLRNEVVTQTVIEVNGKTMVISSVADPYDPARDGLDEARELVLSTMKLPN